MSLMGTSDRYTEGVCSKDKVNLSTSVGQCQLESTAFAREVEAVITHEAFKDKSVKCMVSIRRLYGAAMNSNAIPRFDPYTGQERSLRAGELISLMQAYGDKICSED